MSVLQIDPRSWRASMLAAAVLAAMALAPAPARALSINFNDTTPGGAPGAVLDAWAEAGSLWSALFSDPITVNLDVSFVSFGPGSGSVLGSTATEFAVASYAAVRDALGADAASPDDASAVASLQPGNALVFLTNDQVPTFFFDTDVGFPGNPFAANN